MERKLAAILSADVVGYSRLMEQKEADTFERLRAHRNELFEPEVAKHRGRIFKLMGDGLLAEFGSSVDAVECAAAIQHMLAAHNEDLPVERRIDLRIGVHVGDVIVEGEDRHGDVVNIAARLQQLADPGGICVSRQVVDNVKQKVEQGFESLGEERLKNIAQPVAIYRVVLDGMVRRPRIVRALASVRKRLGAVAIALVLLIAGVLAGWYFYPRPQAPSGEASIAVLPFVNLSGDPGNNYLGQAVAEDIITILSTFPIIHVISRTSSSVYDKPVKVQQVGSDLGVRYVLEGGIQKSGGKVDVTAQLIDAATGDHVWATQFHGEGENVLALQEEVANKVYATIAGFTGEIVKSEQENAWHKSAPSLEEYDYYMRGHALFFQNTKEDIAHARQIWEEGLSKFPDSVILRLKICFTYEVVISRGWSADLRGDLERAWKLGTEAQAIQNKSRLETWLGHWVMAFLYQWHEGDFERSAAEAEAATRMVPYDARSHADLSAYVANAGKTKEAIEWAEKAVRLELPAPDWYRENLAWAFYLAGRLDDSLAQYRTVPWSSSSPALAALYARLGRIEEAHAVIAKILKDFPDDTVKEEAVYPGGKEPLLIEPLQSAYLDDLRKAGLPE